MAEITEIDKIKAALLRKGESFQGSPATGMVMINMERLKRLNGAAEKYLETLLASKSNKCGKH